MAWVGWLSFVVTAIGLWFVASPWIYNFVGNTPLMWNNIILGAITAILSFVAGWEILGRTAGAGMRRTIER